MPENTECPVTQMMVRRGQSLPPKLDRALREWLALQSHSNTTALYDAAMEHYGLKTVFDDEEVEL